MYSVGPKAESDQVLSSCPCWTKYSHRGVLGGSSRRSICIVWVFIAGIENIIGCIYQINPVHSFQVFELFSHSTSSSRFTCVPLSVLWIFTFFPSTNSHFCSFTVTKPAFNSSVPMIIAKGTSSFSPAANWFCSFGFDFARKSVYTPTRLVYIIILIIKRFFHLDSSLSQLLDQSNPLL